MYEIPSLNPFSINKWSSMFEVSSNFIPVVFNFATQLNPGELAKS